MSKVKPTEGTYDDYAEGVEPMKRRRIRRRQRGREVTRHERVLIAEIHEITDALAEALGFTYAPLTGWGTGDLQPRDLAAEVLRRGVMPERGADG